MAEFRAENKNRLFRKKAFSFTMPGMLKFVSAAIVCGLVFLSCASEPFAPGGSRRIPEDFFGMAHAGSRGSPKEYRLLDDMGTVWMRKTFRWDQIQRQSKTWDFGEWDVYVDSGKAAGKKILAVLAYDVGWIYGEETRRRYITPEKIPYFLQYVEGVVRRYKGRVDAWEIWNEPNWVFWQGSDDDFVRLSRETARRIREIDPDAFIVAGSFWRVPERFIRKMFEGGAMENVDAISFHPYALNPRGTVNLFDRFREVLDGYGYQGEIWVTELGHPLRGWYLTRVSEKKFPSYMIKTLAGLAARGARTVFWYELFDRFPKGREPSRFNSRYWFGLNYFDYTPKSGAIAYALFARYAAGAEYRPDLVEDRGLPPSVTAMLFRRDAEDGRGGDGRESAALVLWNEGPGSVPVRIASSGEGMLRYDIATGKGSPAENTLELDLGSRPVFLAWNGDSRVIVETPR